MATHSYDPPPSAREVFTASLSALLHNTPRALIDLAHAEEIITRTTGPRFVFELLQNTRDAAARARTSGARIHLDVTSESLLLANDGEPFSYRGFWAITSVGRSTKDPGQGHIGHKGLGFKSVLRVSRRPQIISRLPDGGRFCVQFGSPRVKELCERAVGGDWKGLMALLEPVEQEAAQEVLAGCPFEQCSLHRWRDEEERRLLPSRLPVMMFPLWLQEIPEEAERLLSGETEAPPFTTVVRLPLEPERVDEIRDRVNVEMERIRSHRKQESRA